MRGVGAAKLRTPRFASAHRGSTGDLREAGMSKKGEGISYTSGKNGNTSGEMAIGCY